VPLDDGEAPEEAGEEEEGEPSGDPLEAYLTQNDDPDEISDAAPVPLDDGEAPEPPEEEQGETSHAPLDEYLAQNDNADAAAEEPGPDEEGEPLIDPADALPEQSEGGAPETANNIGPSAREALARLSAAVREEKAALMAEMEISENPGEAEPADETEEAANPEEIPESEQMDVALPEGEEELEVEPINVADIMIDLDQSRLPEKAAKPVIRAKPLQRA
jgi:hypothetical protein